MKYLITYNKLLENQNSEIDQFQIEADDYMRDLIDRHFCIEVGGFPSKKYEKFVYSCTIADRSNSIFYWKDLKDDVLRYIEMSEFNLLQIDFHTRPKKEIIELSIDNIDDHQELSHIELFFSKK